MRKSVSRASQMAAAPCPNRCCFQSIEIGTRMIDVTANNHEMTYADPRFCSSKRLRTICGSVVCASCSRLGCISRIVAHVRGTVSRGVRGEAERLEEFQEGFGSEANVLDDFAEKVWRNVSRAVKWDSRHATVGVAKLFVRSALTNLH